MQKEIEICNHSCLIRKKNICFQILSQSQINLHISRECSPIDGYLKMWPQIFLQIDNFHQFFSLKNFER